MVCNLLRFSLNIIPLRSLQVVACIGSLFFCIVKYILWIYVQFEELRLFLKVSFQTNCFLIHEDTHTAFV